MIAQNVYSATPAGSEITGFIFTDLGSYKAEYEHRYCLFGTEEYELQIIDGSQIDQELFAGLKINQDNLIEWFNEIQHLTFDEKVGLWFLVDCCGFELTLGLETIQNGVTIFHGTKEELATLSQQPHLPNMELLFQEFHFAGETWVGNPAIY